MVRGTLPSCKGCATVAVFFEGTMGKKKRNRNRDLVVLWKGKVSRVLGQGSDSEVMLLARLVMHKAMTHEEKYLVLEGAIFEVWGQRLADREEEAKARRKRARDQARQEREFSEPILPDSAGSPENTDDGDAPSYLTT